MAQTFAGVRSSTVIVKGNGGLGASPLKKILELTFSTTLENALLHDRRSNFNEMPVTQSIIHHYSVEKTIISPQVFISYFSLYIVSKHMTVFTITLFPYMNTLYSNTIYVLIYSKQYMNGYALHVAVHFFTDILS